MILYPMNEMLTQVSSRYELVNLVARRARQITSAAEKKDGDDNWRPLKEKPVTMALNEAWNSELPIDEGNKEEAQD